MLISIRRTIAELVYPEGPIERRALERFVELDAATGLGSKKALESALPAAEADPDTAVIIIDLNNLGLANKLDGHGRGDWLLRRAARTIRLFTKQLTGSCRAFRFGGDEFVILTDKAWALDLAYILRDRFGKHRISNGEIVSLTAAVGDTFEAADKALQPLKREHKMIERAAADS